jgi:sugar lactone lactonase YvrE
MKTFRAVPASPEIYGLAEGPVWDAPRDRLLWVDINAGAVHAGVLDGDRIEARDRFTIGGTAGAVACSAAGELLVAGARHLYTIGVDGTVTRRQQVVPDDRVARLNDGKCDPAGRFLVGSMTLDEHRGGEVLLRVDHDGRVAVLDDDLSLSNGIGWSPDGTVLYHADSLQRMVWSRGYDTATGAVGERRELVHLDDGSPDGMCVDVQGNIWLAVWGAAQVRCYSPSGTQLATIEVPALNTSSVAFVGPDRDLLMITSASEQLSAAQLATYPDSGRLFTCRVGVTGLPVAPWDGG